MHNALVIEFFLGFIAYHIITMNM